MLFTVILYSVFPSYVVAFVLFSFVLIQTIYKRLFIANFACRFIHISPRLLLFKLSPARKILSIKKKKKNSRADLKRFAGSWQEDLSLGILGLLYRNHFYELPGHVREPELVLASPRLAGSKAT